MAIPQFVQDLRAKLGQDPLPLPGVTAVVVNDEDRVLLVRRSDNGRWTLITGCLEPEEQPAAGAQREIEEETGVVARIERLIAVEALPLQVCPNGDKVCWFDFAFLCRAVSGSARVNDDESTDVAWFALDELPDLPDRQRRCLSDALAGHTEALFRIV